MIDRFEGLGESCRTVPSDGEKTLRKTLAPSFMQALDFLPNRLSNRPRHGITRQPSQFLDEPVGFFVLDVECHYT